MVTKIVAETKCPLEIDLAWAVNAKNSLHKVYGYSPNQLVFGRNPNLPSVINDKPPALERTTSSEDVAKNLNALHEAHKAFIENEASEKCRRALRHKIRPITLIIYQPCDKVYYKHQDSKEWKGPAEVIGCDNYQVFVKQGSLFFYIHPCSLHLIQSPDRSITEGEDV